MLPPELQKPAPRDASLAENLLSRNRSTVRSLYIGSIAIIPLFAAIFVLKFGTDDIVAGILIGAGIGALVALMAFATQVNVKRSIRLFCEGNATLGIIQSIKAPADRRGNTYAYMTIEFKNDLGQTVSGQALSMTNIKEIDLKAGDSVPVLYLKDSKVFGIYSPGLGMTSGHIKKIV
ncbi:MAG TPA: hypothetical protein VI112_12075 [Bacteroidia bacterium]|jgi:gas vesicle protein